MSRLRLIVKINAATDYHWLVPSHGQAHISRLSRWEAFARLRPQVVHPSGFFGGRRPDDFTRQKLPFCILYVNRVAPDQTGKSGIDQLDPIHREDKNVRILGEKRTGSVIEKWIRGFTEFPNLSDRIPDGVDNKSLLHAVVVGAAADHPVPPGRGLHPAHVRAFPARQHPAGNRPLVMIPAFRFVRIAGSLK